MPGVLRSSFIWQFAGGFLLGGVALFALHPADAVAAPAPVAQVR